MTNNNINKKSITKDYGKFVNLIAPYGLEMVIVALINLLCIFLIIFANQHKEIRYGVLIIILIQILFAFFIHIKKNNYNNKMSNEIKNNSLTELFFSSYFAGIFSALLISAIFYISEFDEDNFCLKLGIIFCIIFVYFIIALIVYKFWIKKEFTKTFCSGIFVGLITSLIVFVIMLLFKEFSNSDYFCCYLLGLLIFLVIIFFPLNYLHKKILNKIKD